LVIRATDTLITNMDMHNLMFFLSFAINLVGSLRVEPDASKVGPPADFEKCFKTLRQRDQMDLGTQPETYSDDVIITNTSTIFERIKLRMERAGCKAKLVIDVGFGRTGTNTMIELLGAMGYEMHHGIQEPKLGDLRDFMNDPLGVIKGNELADLPNFTAWADVPFFGIPCQLQARYPLAKFIHVTRNVDDHFKSVQYMHCMWDRPIHCNTAQKCVRALLWGDYFVDDFCANKESLCADLDAPLWDVIKTKFEQNVLAHTELVKSCLPSEQRFDVDLEELSQDGNVDGIMDFLGCGGAAPAVPHNPSVR